MPDRIVLPSDEFARYKKLSAEKGSIEREQKNIVAEWEKRGLFPDKSPENVGKPFVITNGNGDEIGKLTIYACDEKTIPGFIARRIS